MEVYICVLSSILYACLALIFLLLSECFFVSLFVLGFFFGGGGFVSVVLQFFEKSIMHEHCSVAAVCLMHELACM